MRHRLLLCQTALLTIFIGLTSVGSAAGQTPLTGPRIKTAPETFEFGYVPQDATVSHTFWLRNPGTETVNIQQIKPNCGCTRVPPTDSSIAVGDSLPVEIVFGSGKISGKVEKFTRIMSNAAGRVPALTFRALVYKPEAKPGTFAVTPEVLNTGKSITGKITLKNTSQAPLRIMVVDLPPSVIQLDTNEMSLEPEESKELSISLIAQTSEGDFTKSVTFEANDPAKTRITLPITNVLKE